MKYKGTKLTGSSLLTIIGVVCFASVLVSAAVLMSGIIWTNNVVQPYTYSKTDVSSTTFDTTYVNIPANAQDAIKGTPYVFGVEVVVNKQITNGLIKIVVTNTTVGASAAEVTLAHWAPSTWTAVSSSAVGAVTTFTYTMATPLTPPSTVDHSFKLTYTGSGTYSVAISIEGTSP